MKNVTINFNQPSSPITNTPDVAFIGGGAPASWVNDFNGLEFTEFRRKVL